MDGPLKGVVVLDLTRFLSGPYCTMILGNLGARIIKVEQPGTGDEMRLQAPLIDGESAICSGLNRGKESIALDLRKAEDRKIFEQLVKKSDIFVENFRPGVMDRLGYSWDTLQKLNPKLVGGCISGFGQTGPESQRACYDIVAQGITGLMTITGFPGQPPVKAGIDIGDISAGMFAAIGILAALFERNQKGKGQRIGISLLDSITAMMLVPMGTYSAEQKIPTSTGNSHTLVAPFDAYPTKDLPITVAVANDHLFERFCNAIGHEELIKDDRFKTNIDRMDNVAELTEIIKKALKQKTSKEWIELFLKNGVPAGPIHKMDMVCKEPQLLSRNMIAKFQGEYMPGFCFPGNPIKSSAHKDTNEYPPGPKLNQHREEILKWLQHG